MSTEYRPLSAIDTAVRGAIDDGKEVPPLGGADTAIRASTINAACELSMEDEVGSLVVGKKADLVVLDKTHF